MTRFLGFLGFLGFFGLACGGGTTQDSNDESDAETVGTSTDEDAEDGTADGGNGPEVEPGDIIITEALFAPFNSADDLRPQKYVELYNTTDEPIDLQGLDWSAGGSSYTEIRVSVVVPPKGYCVIGNSMDQELNRGIPVQWEWGISGHLADQGGDLALALPDETIIDGVDVGYPEWEFDRGLAWSLDSGSLDHIANDDRANWCQAETWYLPADLEWSPGTPNPPCP